MAKMNWDDFVTTHPRSICIFTSAGGIKIKAGTLAPDGRKMPTAYGMLIEALGVLLKGDPDWKAASADAIIDLPNAKNTTGAGPRHNFGAQNRLFFNLLKQLSNQEGDWTARKVGNAIHIVVAQAADLALVQKTFQTGAVTPRPMPAPCGQAFQFIYGPQEYSRLAKGLKYVPAR